MMSLVKLDETYEYSHTVALISVLDNDIRFSLYGKYAKLIPSSLCRVPALLIA